MKLAGMNNLTVRLIVWHCFYWNIIFIFCFCQNNQLMEDNIVCNTVLHTRCISWGGGLCLCFSQAMILSALHWWKQCNCLWKEWNNFSTFWSGSPRGSNAWLCSAKYLSAELRHAVLWKWVWLCLLRDDQHTDFTLLF